MRGQLYGYWVEIVMQEGKSQLSATERMILITLGWYANHELKAWPSIDTISSFSALNEKTIRTSLKDLELKGYINRTIGASSSTYQLVKPVVFGIENNIMLSRLDVRNKLMLAGLTEELATDTIDLMRKRFNAKAILYALNNLPHFLGSPGEKHRRLIETAELWRE